MSVRFNATADDLRRASLGFGSQTAWTFTCWGQIVTDRNNFSTFWTIANTVSDTTNNALLQTANDGTSLEYFDGGSGNHAVTALTVGTWYFIGISINGTSGFAKVSADGSGTFTTVSLSGLASSTTHNFIMFGDSTFNGEFLNGRVEAAKWWSTNLSQAEVEAEKPARSPVRTSNVRAYWYFTASKTADTSGNGLTLTESNVVDLEGSPTNLSDTAGLPDPEPTDTTGLTDDVTKEFQRPAGTDTTGLTDNVVVSLQSLRTITDSAGLVDTSTFVSTFNRTQTDVTGLVDTTNILNAPPGPMPQDTTGLTDVASISQQKNPTDDAGLDDDTAIISTFNRPVTDGVGLSNGVGLAAAYNRVQTDTAGLSDAATPATSFARQATDDTGLTDNVTRSFQRPVEDLLGLSDEVTRILHKTVDDSVGLSDDPSRAVAYSRVVDEGVGLDDDHAGVATFNRSITESAGLTEDLNRLVHKTRDDYLPIVDTVITQVTFPRTPNDTEGLSDSFSLSMVWARSFDDSVGLTDNLTKQLGRFVQDSVGLSDEVDLDLYRLEVIQTDSVGLTDQVGIVRTRTFTKTDDTELADNVVLSLVSQRAQVDTVGLADQTVVGLASSRGAVDSAGLTDGVLVTLTHIKTINDTLGLSDTAQTPVVFNRPITDSVGLRDYPSRPDVTFSRTFSDGAGPTDNISVTRSLTLTDSMSLADNVTQARTWNRTFLDTLSISDTITRFASYTRSITDSVGLRDLPSVKVPTQEEWDFEFGNFRKAWRFSLTAKSWRFGDLEKAWRMTMAQQIVETTTVATEDFEVTVSAREAGVEIDPRVDPVHFAFETPGTSPSGSTTWVAGTWGVQDQPGDLPDLYLAIGTASGHAAGRYDIWCRVTHGAKTPMDKVGVLIVK